jgi:hypothetical protein
MGKVLLVLMLVALAIGGVLRLRTGTVLAQGGNDYCCECMDGSRKTVRADSFAIASSECSVACAASEIRKVTEGKCS